MDHKIRKSRFVVSKALLPLTDGGYWERWYVYLNNVPITDVNNFLRWKSIRSSLTGRTYAYAIAVWMNFLADREKTFLSAEINDFKAYVNNLVYRVDKNIISISQKISFSTLSGYINVVGSFYKWLEDMTEISFAIDSNPESYGWREKKRKKRKPNRFWQIYESSLNEMLDIDVRGLRQTKLTKQWLTEIQKTAIINQLRSDRDKSIFLLLLEGMRIDEVLSLHHQDFDSNELMVKPRRSKGKIRIDDIRFVYFTDPRTETYLTRYVQTERADLETELNEFILPLFVNLKHTQHYGKEVSYRNYLEILKRAVKKAGLDSKHIATHVGRRTHVQEMLDAGQDGDAIKVRVGWSSTLPLKAYTDSKRTLKRIAERMREKTSQNHFKKPDDKEQGEKSM
jgi:site-specific recombinase XerD